MVKPKNQPKTAVYVRLPREVAARLAEYAESRGMKKCAVVERALKDYMR